MAFVGKTVGKVLGGVLKTVGLVQSPGKAPAPLPTVTRDDAVAQQQADDELRRRKGGAADILNGASGSEATLTGGKLVLG